MPLMKGSVVIKLRGRLLRVFPIWDWTLVAFAQIFINDLVSTLTFCAETGKMWELTGDLGYHKAEEEATEDWNKKNRWLYDSTKAPSALYIKYIYNKVRKILFVDG